MEIPCKHDKKKNLKNLPMAINVSSSGLGIGGVVLVGGALVTAAIVSALAFRSKSQRRSSLENMKKNMSQSMETQSVDVPNMLELVIKTDTDFSPSEEVTSMKEIQNNNNNNNSQSLAPDKKHDEKVHSGDTNEGTIDSVVAKNQENTSIRVGSAFESEEQVVMAVQKDSCLERDDEGLVSIEEYEAVDVPIKDTVGKASKNDDVIEDGETHMNQVNVEDHLHDEIIIENCEGDLIEETGHADQIVHELVTEEEAIDAAPLLQIEIQKCPRVQLLDGQDEIILENCEGDLSNKKGPANQIMREGDRKMECSSKQVMVEHAVASDAQERQVNKNCETFVAACVMNQLKEAVGDQTMVNEDTPLSRLINNEEEDKETAQKVEEHVTIEDEAAKEEVTTEHELVRKDEFPHVEFVKEDEDSEEPTSNHKIEETPMQVKEEIITDHELIQIEEIPHVESVKEDEDVEEDVTVKAELSCSVNAPSVHEEPTPEAKINNHKIEETDVEVKGEMVTDHALVKKDEIPHFESVNEDDDGEKDVTVKVKLSSGVSSSSVQEEPTPEAKNDNHKIEENIEENQTTLGKNHNCSEEDVTLKANLSSGVSSPYVLEEPTPEAKIGNHNNEENTEENQTLLGENHQDNEEDVTAKVELSSGVNSSTLQDKPTPNNRKIEENMDVNQTILGKKHNDNNSNRVIKEQAFVREPWNLKLMAWSGLISVWCLCHWYSELPFPELSLVGSLLFILILLGYRSRTTHLVKYK